MGLRIRTERALCGWTQEMLAEKVGLSVSFLGHIERGTRKASLDTVIKIINSLGTDADSVLIDSLHTPSRLRPQLNDQQKLTLREAMRVINDSVESWTE